MAARVEIFEEGREERFARLVRKATDILVVSPFVGFGAAQLLLKGNKHKNIRVITRFNLEDFVAGVSQLRALELLVKAGARIRGCKGLHSKLYLFDDESIIVSSANLTRGGLIHNLEFGLEIEGHAVVAGARSYFERLWAVAENDLSLDLISRWKDEVDCERVRRGHNKLLHGQLPDYGIELAPRSALDDIPTSDLYGALADIGNNEAPRVYVKFFGSSDDRWGAERYVREALQDSECYYACTYPRNKRPRSIHHSDIIYMACMTTNPIGYAIFGKAVAIPYQEGRDDATPNEIARLGWKNKWPHYIRVFDPIFIDAPLSDCVWFTPIIDRLGAHAFASTARNLAKGEGNTDPKKSLMRKPHVEVTTEGAQLISSQFEERLRSKGSVPRSFIEGLPKPDIQVRLAGS